MNLHTNRELGKKLTSAGYDKTDFFECPICGGINCWTWYEGFAESSFRGDAMANIEGVDIYHVGASSCAGVECGKCLNHFTEKSSIYASNLFTHCKE